jgi:serine/threonine-protein kinase ULK/ATG1
MLTVGLLPTTFSGQGSFAMVYRGQNRVSKRTVAVKAIVRARLNQKLQQNLEAEITILQSLQHPNIVRLHDVQTTERHVYLIMELCPGGDLMRVIRTHGAQSEGQTRNYLLQLARGLRYLRDHNLVHRDLKPQNLLLSSSQPDAVLKIADFGFARYMQQADMAETLCGSPLYMAPEILRFQKYDAKADLWSVGTIIYELLTARPPFTGANHVQVLPCPLRRPPARARPDGGFFFLVK